MTNNIAIITARGGSKRIPRKNIKDFLGKPIIQYSIEAAIKSNLFDEVMVSTDDEEIASFAKKIGAKVPFYRSAKSSDDHATTAEVLAEVLASYKKENKTFEYACCIYPTAPFVTSVKLKIAYNMILDQHADVVMPVAKYSVPIWWALKKEKDYIKLHWPENADKRSQDLAPAYFDCGQFYFFEVDAFLKTKSLFTINTLGLEVPETEVQDIDNIEDWAIAEIKYKLLNN
jgi:pseudaminic acid cytidylyltransferase